MPHVIVKLWPGRSEDQKRDLSDAIARDVTNILNYGDESVSICFEEVSPAEWLTQVYEPDIQRKWGMLTKTPGYGPGPQSAD